MNYLLITKQKCELYSGETLWIEHLILCTQCDFKCFTHITLFNLPKFWR